MTNEQMKQMLADMISHSVRQALSDPINAAEWTAYRICLQDADAQLAVIRHKTDPEFAKKNPPPQGPVRSGFVPVKSEQVVVQKVEAAPGLPGYRRELNVDDIIRAAEADRIMAAKEARALMSSYTDEMTARMFCICVKVQSIDAMNRERLYPNEMKVVIKQGTRHSRGRADKPKLPLSTSSVLPRIKRR